MFNVLFKLLITAGVIVITVVTPIYENPLDNRVIPTDFSNAEAQEKKMFVSMYDPGIQDEINCERPCERTRSGASVKDNYWKGAACPYSMMGDTILVPHVGTFRCIDTGSAVNEEEDHIVIDLLVPESQFDLIGYDFSALIDEWYIIKGD